MSKSSRCPILSKEENHLPSAARAYLKAGYSVLPVTRDKRPALSGWKRFQDNPPALEEMGAWFRNPEVTGVGIICGAVSFGLFIVDFDLEAESIFPEWKSKLGNPALTIVKTFKGYHVYFRCTHPPGNEKWARDENDGTLIECKGEGGYCLAPPSLHPEGVRYHVLEGDVLVPRNFDLPQDFLETLRGISATFDRSAPVTRSHTPLPSKPFRPRRSSNRWEWACSLLSRLAPWRADDVKDWLRVGYALTEFGEDGFALWNEWSKQSNKYPGEEEMRRRWKYLCREGKDA